ncbi:MAG: hypothetical protein ACRD4F_02215 [Candidatus Angelobacter sp.]
MANTSPKLRLIVTTAALLVIAAMLGAWRQFRVEPGFPIRQIYLALNPYRSSDGSQFWIRVTEQPEAKRSPAFVAGAFYSFSSGPSENGPWQPMMMVHLDNPNPIPTNNVVFVNSRLAFAFLYGRLAVTNDAGNSWSIWPDKESPQRGVIKDVLLSADGSGTMQLRVFANQQVVTLHTHDFGKSWTREQEP